MDYKKYLTENVMPFWLKNGVDEEYGGIFTCLDRKGEVYDTEKSVWFQGRSLWAISKAYNYIEKKPEYLEAAKKIFEFFPLCEGEDGRMYFTVTREGKVTRKRRYYFSETFAAIGCAEYYKASGDKKAWERAEKYFNIALNCFEHPETLNAKFETPTKGHSPVMIMVATARVMAECADEPEKYREIARKYTDEILHGGYINENYPGILETIGADGAFLDTISGRVVNPGHSLETAWFLFVEGLLEDNKEALTAAKRVIDTVLPVGIDEKYGGIRMFYDVLGKPITVSGFDTICWNDKFWWAQNEAIIATRMAYEIFGEEKYKELSDDLLEFCFEKFADDEYGEWYGYLNYDATLVSDVKGNLYKGPFHLPRMLMVLDYIEKGKMIDIFK